VRVLGREDVHDFDPFLMLDAFDSSNPEDYVKGFPWHPHRGIETITYLIEGDIEHGDSLGNHGRIQSGDCQWMTAGSGIVHQEMPRASSRLFGTQLWLNMPSKDKMAAPRYGDILGKDIPLLDEEKAAVRVLSGTYMGRQGAMTPRHVRPTYLDVTVRPGMEWTVPTDHGDTVFAYILEGEGCFGPRPEDCVPEKHAVLLSDGDTFRVQAEERGIRFLLLAAKPLKEPIAWGGPIVMNTREELNQAFRELDDGSFLRH
jgi:hypothetical protein